MPLATVKRKSAERRLLRRILRLAKRAGWRAFHPAPARFGQAWRTPYAGDSGFPDLVLVRPPVVLFVEVKAGKRKPTLMQQQWLQALRQCGKVHACVWRESDWDAGVIQQILQGGDEGEKA
ncbi:MAG: VRR-NUC domain-containing protein [Armatimonadota bacterium]